MDIVDSRELRKDIREAINQIGAFKKVHDQRLASAIFSLESLCQELKIQIETLKMELRRTSELKETMEKINPYIGVVKERFDTQELL